MRKNFMMYQQKLPDVWDIPTQFVRVVLPIERKGTKQQQFFSLLAFLGAVLVVGLYVLVPLIIFFGVLHDWLLQVFITAILFSLSEFGVCSILVHTSKGQPFQKIPALKHQPTPSFGGDRIIEPRLTLRAK
jgi:hypothetical protein